MAGLADSIRNIIKKYHLYVLKDVALFVLITVLIHVLWRIWAKQFDYAPVHDFMYRIMGAMATEVYRESVWIISGMYDIVRVDESMHMFFPNKSIMYINTGCSGLKQIIQFSLLMFLFPGPVKQKIWFIPLGILIMHLTNIFRIVGLSVVIMNWPQYGDFSHNYLFRLFFYVVIFVLWLYWVEIIRRRGEKR
jgi:exosortase/archaeosortase family protein